MDIRQGLPVSRGIAIGEVFLLEAEGARIPEHFLAPEEAEHEAERMRKAVEYLKELGVDGFMLWSPPWPKAQVPWEGPPAELFRLIQEAAE